MQKLAKGLSAAWKPRQGMICIQAAKLHSLSFSLSKIPSVTMFRLAGVVPSHPNLQAAPRRCVRDCWLTDQTCLGKMLVISCTAVWRNSAQTHDQALFNLPVQTCPYCIHHLEHTFFYIYLFLTSLHSV